MDLEPIGAALIVGGLAFLCSGLIFLLPAGRKVSSPQDSIEENSIEENSIEENSIEESRDRVDRALRAARSERGDLS
jgi:hypothetical protein